MRKLENLKIRKLLHDCLKLPSVKHYVC